MGLQAKPEELDNFAKEMQRQHDAIRDMINKARGHAHDLSGAAFQGAAGAAFQDSFESYLESATRLNDTLMANGDKVRDAGKKYDEIEEQNLVDIKSTNLLNMQ
jgi:WXG100 family type VII secretion target